MCTGTCTTDAIDVVFALPMHRLCVLSVCESSFFYFLFSSLQSHNVDEAFQ